MVQVLGICVHPDGEKIYLVMDLMSKSLDKIIFDPNEHKKLTVARKKDIALQVAAGMFISSAL